MNSELISTLQRHGKVVYWLNTDTESGAPWVVSNSINLGIDYMGGFDHAASLLKVTVEDLYSWLDTNLVPEKYRPIFMKLTDYPEEEFSASKVYVLLPEYKWWPHEPQHGQLAAAEAFYC